jgi:RING-box protein 1
METDAADVKPPLLPAPAAEGSSAAGPSSSRKPTKRFEIKKWNAVALWAWGTRAIRPAARQSLTLVFDPV